MLKSLHRLHLFTSCCYRILISYQKENTVSGEDFTDYYRGGPGRSFVLDKLLSFSYTEGHLQMNRCLVIACNSLSLQA